MEEFERKTEKDIEKLSDDILQEWVGHIKSKASISAIELFSYAWALILFVLLILLLVFAEDKFTGYYFMVFVTPLFCLDAIFIVYKLISKSILSKKMFWYYGNHISFLMTEINTVYLN